MTMPANAFALTVGKKERLFIRYKPHPPRAKRRSGCLPF
jgi:hypothetical protein